MATEQKLSRKERNRLRHKDEILNSALTLFAEKGYPNVSMQEIADAAEFSVGTLYNLFASKDALLDELLDRNTRLVMASILAVLDGPGNEAERLRDLFRYLPDLMETHAAFTKVHFAEVGPCSAGRFGKEGPAAEFRTVVDAKVAEIIAAGVEKKLFRAVDPVITAKAIHAIIENLAFEIVSNFDRAAVEDVYAKAEQLFLDGLLLPGGPDEDH
jgi:AcrR family transcriptional regulator